MDKTGAQIIEVKDGAARKTAPRVAVSTLGCKANQYDSSAIEETLAAAGCELVAFDGPADAYVINTCTVTARTDAESRRMIRAARRLAPEAVVVVTGCYAEVSSAEAAAVEGVDYVVGNSRKDRIPDLVAAGRPLSAVAVTGPFRAGTPFTLRARSSSSRTRANLKVQEGCSRACTYCIIPKARGYSKSLPLAEVAAELDALMGAGYREVVLTGIHLGAYGEDTGSSIARVLEMMETRPSLEGARFRISSLDPDELTDEVMEILKGARRVCNHLHLPLQSGDDAVLRRMARPYTASRFAERAGKLASSVRGVSIGVDVMTGFPGETDAEFENTMALLRDCPVSYLHVFPYSRRAGTPAASFKGQVAPAVVRRRRDALKRLDTEKRSAFHSAAVGTVAEVLVETASRRGDGTMLLKGKSRNYIPVVFEGGGAANAFQPVEVTGAGPASVTGRALGGGL